MRQTLARWTPLVCALALAGCQERGKADPPPDGGGGVTASFQVTVAPSTLELAEAASQSVQISVTGDVQGSVRLSLRSAPTWASLSGTTLLVSPGYSDAGKYELLVAATDGRGAMGFAAFRVTVKDVKRPPVLADIPALTVVEGEVEEVALSASDPDDEPLDLTFVGTEKMAVAALCAPVKERA